MKLIINRKQDHYGFPLNKFEYTMRVKAEFSSAESQLLEKYKGSNHGIRVLPDNNSVRGAVTISPKTLSEKGAEWLSDEIYLLLSEMPDALAKALKTIFSEYHVRKEWGQSNANEVIEVNT